MTAAIITAIASVIVVVLGLLLPGMSDKHDREVALLEADLMKKLPDDDLETQKNLRWVAQRRTRRWRRQEKSRPGRIAWQLTSVLIGLALLSAAIGFALTYWADPAAGSAQVSELLSSAASSFLWLTIAFTVLGLVGVVFAFFNLDVTRAGLKRDTSRQSFWLRRTLGPAEDDSGSAADPVLGRGNLEPPVWGPPSDEPADAPIPNEPAWDTDSRIIRDKDSAHRPHGDPDGTSKSPL